MFSTASRACTSSSPTARQAKQTRSPSTLPETTQWMWVCLILLVSPRTRLANRKEVHAYLWNIIHLPSDTILFTTDYRFWETEIERLSCVFAFSNRNCRVASARATKTPCTTRAVAWTPATREDRAWNRAVLINVSCCFFHHRLHLIFYQTTCRGHEFPIGRS